MLVTLVYLALQTRQNTMAIGAQLDSARITSILNLNMAAATSNEMQEALAEDRVGESSVSKIRRGVFFANQFALFQWEFQHAQRDLLPGFNATGVGRLISSYATSYRSFEGWWENAKPGYASSFVEWVEEQRSKAA